MLGKTLPIGFDDFKDIVQNNYYYVDKTLFIKELLDSKGQVNLFTRPRRFGKTLNLSMLRYFFENTSENPLSLFQGTKIMQCDSSYLNHMGQYPVIFLTLKSMKQTCYDDAFYSLKEEIAREYRRHDVVLESLKYKAEQDKYLRFIDRSADPKEYLSSILFLSSCLRQHYKQKVVILIDEYDVPLENAYFCNYYEKMIPLIRAMFESVLKTNENLAFSVITGCLRISRESIFTGLNNLQIMSITSENYAEYFGFTDSEVDEILTYYGLSQNKSALKKWYDGYTFGNQHVYNPWSVMNYVQACTTNADATPLPYWSNTSSNNIVHHLINCADISVKGEIETLIEGKSIIKAVHEDVTYEDMEDSQDNLWNFLFFTGYLTKIRELQDEEFRYLEMKIPNSEVRYIYKRTILRWFEEKTESKDLSELYRAILNGSSEKIEEILSNNLLETISFYDSQESFYHGFLVGLLKNMRDYKILSNRESGNGRPDILIKYPSVRGTAVILEVKIAEKYADLDKKCDEALKQIEIQKYASQLHQEGYTKILKYGVAFYKKECKVKQGTN